MQFAAALPVDPFKNLLVDGIPYYVQFAGNPLFQLSVFRSEAFHHLVKLVHESQINSHRLKINLPTDTVHVVTQMIESSIKTKDTGLTCGVSSCDVANLASSVEVRNSFSFLLNSIN